jgi:hypothetical protein
MLRRIDHCQTHSLMCMMIALPHICGRQPSFQSLEACGMASPLSVDEHLSAFFDAPSCQPPPTAIVMK